MTSLERALAAARSCGVTRLADITRLDRVGVSVFQAVRPWGRALSVHQGKGLDAETAKIGALMEAVEADHAESFAGESRRCAFGELPPERRAASMADFARHTARPPSEDRPRRWVGAERLNGGGTLWVPFDVVSLDFTRRGDTRLDRSSNGLGAGFDRDHAIVTALLEVIERDAVQAWRAGPVEQRTRDRVAALSIPFAWFRDLYERLKSAGLSLSIYHVPAIVPLPVFVCELAERSGEGRWRNFGAACRPLTEAALQRSVVEAAQSRLTMISGVRDDIAYAEPDDAIRGGLGLALPMPTHLRPLSWESVQSIHSSTSCATPSNLARLLAAAGFPDAAIVDLSRPAPIAHVVKAVVPGLADWERGRREGSTRS
ncbi:MAG: YcaO-like family protein [Caulobacteraceae bacterium]